MGKITLNLESNAPSILAETTDKMSRLRQSASEFEDQGKNAFGVVTKKADDMNKEIDEANKMFQKLPDHLKKSGDSVSVVTKNTKELTKEMGASDKSANTLGKTVVEHVGKKGQKAIESLTKQLKALKRQIQETTDPKELERLTVEAGHIKDAIDDANEAVAIFASGSKFQILSKAFGNIGQKILALDFEGAVDGSKLLIQASKQLTFKDGIAAVKQLGTTLFNMGKALLTNPLFLIPTLIVLIISNFEKLKHSGGLIGKVFTALGEIIKDISDKLEKFGQLIGLTADESEKAAQRTIDNMEKVVAAIENRYDNELKLQQAAGRNTAEIEKEKIRAVREAVKEQLTALLYKYKRQGELSEEEQKLYKDGLQRQKDLLFDLAAVELREQKRVNDEKLKAQKEYNDKRKQIEADFQALLAELHKRYAQAEIDISYGPEKLQKIRDLQIADVDLLRKHIEEKGKLLDKNFKLSAEQEKEFARLKDNINSEYYQGIINYEVETEKVREEARKKSLDNQLNFLQIYEKLQTEIAQALVAPAGSTILEKERFELVRQRKILEIQQKSAADQIQLKKDQIDTEAQIQIDALNAELQLLERRDDELARARSKAILDEVGQIKQGADLSKKEVLQSLNNTLTGIENEISGIDKKLQKHPIDWQKILGLSDEQFLELKKAIPELKDQLQQVANAYFALEQSRLDAEMSSIDKRIEGRDRDIESLKERLAKEEDLGKQGLANNADRIKAELRAKEDARQKDLAAQKRIKDEKKKLAKEQFAVDTAVQASNLVTGISEVFATYGEVPYVAALLAAAMVAAFALTRIQAYNAVESDAGFKKGGYTGDGDPNEVAGKTHKQEFVHTAEKTRKNRELFEGIHTGDKRRIITGVSDLLRNTGVVLPEDYPEQLEQKKADLRQAEFQAYFNHDNSGVERRLDKIDARVKDLAKERPTIFEDAHGNIIIQKGSTRTIIKKK